MSTVSTTPIHWSSLDAFAQYTTLMDPYGDLVSGNFRSRLSEVIQACVTEAVEKATATLDANDDGDTPYLHGVEVTAENIERVQTLVGRIRDAYGCGNVNEEINPGLNEDYDTISAYVRDVSDAVDRVANASLDDAASAVENLRHELSYLTAVDWDGGPHLSGDAEQRVSIIGGCLRELADLGL